jgi:hypothetical protein
MVLNIVAWLKNDQMTHQEIIEGALDRHGYSYQMPAKRVKLPGQVRKSHASKTRLHPGVNAGGLKTGC